MLGWVTGDWSDAHRVLTHEIAEQFLLGEASSPLRRALVESGLGAGIAEPAPYACRIFRRYDKLEPVLAGIARSAKGCLYAGYTALCVLEPFQREQIRVTG